jgi:uncharacterized membrane protein
MSESESVAAAAPALDTREAEPAMRPSPPPIPAQAPSAAAASPAPSRVVPPTRTAPGRSAQDSGPDLGQRLATLLFGGNLPVKLGILVLFAGVAAALRYAAEQGYFNLPIGWRFSLIAAAALGGLVFALSQRRSRPAFSLSLQGGAIGVLLLEVFAGFRLYELMQPATALVLVVVLVALAATLAVVQSAVGLAVLGFLGGYLGPVLISTGSGDHVALFTYYAVLNAAVFAIAWWRHWYPLNLLGFAFTFAIGSLWGLRSYTAEDYASTQFFLLLFWGFYLGITVLGALRRGAAASRAVEASLTFGLPLLAFSLQSGLLEGDRPALARAALLAAIAYAVLAALLIRVERARLQGESFAWIAAGFATLAVPLAFSSEQTAMVWALQGVGAMWLGLRQQRALPQLAGACLQILAGLAFVLGAVERIDAGQWSDPQGLLTTRTSVVLLAFAGLLGSYVYERLQPQRLAIWALFGLGSIWLGALWLHLVWKPPIALDSTLAAVAFSATFASLAAALRWLTGWARLSWQVVPQLALAPLLAMLVFADSSAPPLDGNGLSVWLLWLGSAAFALHCLREPPARLTGLGHIAVLATLAMVLGIDSFERADRAGLGEAWTLSLGLLPLTLLAAGLMLRPGVWAWPLADRFQRYARAWHAIALAVLAMAWIGSLYLSADPAPMAYLPLLNPLELLQWGLLLAAWRSIPAEDRADLIPLRVGVGLAALSLLSLMVLRCVHHFGGLAWSASIFDSALTQGGLSVLWAVLGVWAWVRGSRRGEYPIWLAGAVLMGVVLLKLVLVDRAYLGNLAGIGAVLTVGLLLVGVGYVAPSPPRQGGEATR